MKRMLIAAVLAIACAATGYAQTMGPGVGVEVGKETFLSVMFPLEGLTLQALLDVDSVSGASDDVYVEAGAAIWLPLTEVGDATLNALVQGLYESVTDKDAGYTVLIGLAPWLMIGEKVGLGGKIGVAYSQHVAEQGEDANTQVGLEGSVGVHWFF